jgi:hypothetical protein
MSCDKSNKRPRLSMASCGSINDDGPDESLSRRHQQPSSLLDGDALLESSAAMISVPVELIFRQVLNEGQPKPLLSRSEAQTFLCINVLCEQLDSLTNLNEALLQEEQETSLSDNVIQNDHPQLRSLQVVLSSYHERRPAWSELPNRLTAILVELVQCCSVLRHCSEQNWSVSELLGPTIGMEKRKLSDVEDEICRRVQLILHGQRTTSRHRQASSGQEPEECDPMPTMKDFYHNIFHECTEKESFAFKSTSTELGWNENGARQDSALSTRPAVNSVPFAAQAAKDGASWTNMDVQSNDQSSALTSAPQPARSLALHAQENKAALPEGDCSDDDELLEDLGQQPTHSTQNEDSLKQQTATGDAKSQDVTSPEASPKQGVEKENEPSQSSHSSSFVEDTTFRSQNAAEVLSTLSKMT